MPETQPPPDPTTARARDTALTLLARRSPNATICPSEVARAIASASGWRDAMPLVHDAMDSLLKEGRVTLSWKGTSMTTRNGPYRIGGATPSS
ncbi:DUF3253 domain-containing protein [Sphingomonas aliaeris]|uniref:DUF3253 domain-containing protein n=1 Tax=Sphingomonas aliaeris TaxID=2759526 RepID=A0A974S4R5_9SPHN|nr:DUF3253 domain-containing protein [Sphingomonas aliaeris]QQV77908.1 DUF3253 domain-containing protein [Sphingomonas aliaeris]